MSTVFVGGRRVQLRAIFLIAVVFSVIIVFTTSSTRLQQSLNEFKSNYGYGDQVGAAPAVTSSPKSDASVKTPPPAEHHAGSEKPSKPATGGNQKMATDPCVSQALPQGGVTPRKVSGTKVLVTGGAGFIGSNLVDRLLELGYKVRIFDNLYTGFIRNVPLHDDRVEFMLGDIMDPKMLEKAVEGVEYVYHLAAMSKVVPSLKNPEMARFCVEANALGTWNVLNAVRDQGKIKKVVYAASSTYYGNNPPPHSEDMAPDFLTPYAASKYEGELQMQMFDRLFNVDTISTRFFMVYGPRQPSTGAYAIVTGVFAKQAADGKQLTIEGDGSHYRDFIHVQDIVNGLILSQQDPKLHGNVVNLGTGSAFSVQDVADLVSKDQIHVDARKNDLEGTLADTCRMKKLLGYQAKMDFKKEMSYMVDQTLAGNVFMQDWLKTSHALSAPHLLAPGTPVFNWPKTQTDIDELLTAIEQLNTSSSKQLTVIPFSLGSSDATVISEILLNTIFSLVRFGEVESYIVVAQDKTALETCVALNLPCFDAHTTGAPKVINTILGKGYNVHLAQIGNSYISSVSDFFKAQSKADVYVAKPYGDIFIHSTAHAAVQTWAESASKSANLFVPAAWKSFSAEATAYTREPVCETTTATAGKTPSSTGVSKVPSEKAQALSDNKNVEASYEKEIESDVSTEKRAPATKFCGTHRFYVSIGCKTENEAGIEENAEGVKAALKKNGLWHLTECADKVHCDIQQSVPFRWVAKTPDLKETGGFC